MSRQAPKRSLLGLLAVAVLYLVGRVLGVELPLFESAAEPPTPAAIERAEPALQRDVSARTGSERSEPTDRAALQRGSRQLAELFAAGRSDTWVEAAGEVVATLRDDTHGSQHQRFLVRVGPDQTVLIAHNIDLAPRVPLQRGDIVHFRGEYEWNEKGGVVHWTHHDPGRRHAGGWIEHEGQRYK